MVLEEDLRVNDVGSGLLPRNHVFNDSPELLLEGVDGLSAVLDSVRDRLSDGSARSDSGSAVVVLRRRFELGVGVVSRSRPPSSFFE